MRARQNGIPGRILRLWLCICLLLAVLAVFGVKSLGNIVSDFALNA